MTTAVLLAVDWGTTNLRAWTVDAAGAPLARREFPLGVSRLQPGEAAVRFREVVRPALDAQALPAVVAGMAGSNLGWIEAPYVDCPADAAKLAAKVVTVPGEDPPVGIVPGLRAAGALGPDVMRGEETQLIGWLAQDPSRRRGTRLVCHPGTHAKWAVVADGRIRTFVTAMTGELFAVLTQHSVLRGAEGPSDGAAFETGVAAAGDGSALAARLFSARARVVGGGGLRPEEVRAYLSGLLIGADVAATPRLLDLPPRTPVALVGDERLCAQYARALAVHGTPVEVHDGEAAALAGLHALYKEGATR